MSALVSLRVTVVGLGLMGGSLALALRPFVGALTAVDPDAATREQALAAGLVDTAAGDLAGGVAGADLVVLAAPVRAILVQLAELPALRPDGCLILDLGSTKAAIAAAMERLPPPFGAVGGHPLCGREMAGLAAAAADLYRGQTFVLCRTGRTSAAAEATALAIVEAIGAWPLFLDPAEHDELVALTSHLPYLTAAALLRLAAGAGDERLWTVSASGFAGAVRLAGSDPTMMADILLTNRTAVLDRLAAYRAGLTAVIDLLASGDEAALIDWLAATQAAYRRYRAAKG